MNPRGEENGPFRGVLTVLGAATSAIVLVGLVLRFVSPTPERPVAEKRVARDAAAPAPAAAALATTTQAAAPSKRPLNVILITVDTLRADLGFAGYDKPITPNIDALAAKSTIFERAYSGASYTPKSFGTMMSGRYMSELNRNFEHYTLFAPSNVFLAERVHDRGVRTFAATCHHYFAWKTGFQQGFDVWDTTAMPPAMQDSDPRPTSEGMTRAALKLLGDPKNTGGRFFAWFHYFDPHTPYVNHPGAPSFGTGVRAVYDEEVWFTDKWIGKVLDFVSKQPWAQDTAIIFTADHGEAFGEHNFFRHGHELWEPLVRVPLFVYVPGAAARRVPQKRSHIDIAPTVLDLMGIPAPGDGALHGKPLLEDVQEERDVFMDMPAGPFNDARRAFVSGPSPGMKIIEKAPRVYELYDLAADPGENKNLAKDDAKLREVLTRYDALKAKLREVPVTR